MTSSQRKCARRPTSPSTSAAAAAPLCAACLHRIEIVRPEGTPAVTESRRRCGPTWPPTGDAVNIVCDEPDGLCARRGVRQESCQGAAAVAHHRHNATREKKFWPCAAAGRPPASPLPGFSAFPSALARREPPLHWHSSPPEALKIKGRGQWAACKRPRLGTRSPSLSVVASEAAQAQRPLSSCCLPGCRDSFPACLKTSTPSHTVAPACPLPHHHQQSRFADRIPPSSCLIVLRRSFVRLHRTRLHD